MEIFAKEFKTTEHGQIVVMKNTTDDDKPCINIIFKTPKTDIVQTSMGFTVETSRDSAFDQIDEKKAIAFVSSLKNDYEMI